MAQFLTPLDYRKVDDRVWQLLSELIYEREEELLVVPGGFVTNGASIPRVFYITTPPVGEYDQAAVLHDWLYTGVTGKSRKECDQIFKEAMQVCGVGWYTRNKMYFAVRAFGSKHFNDKAQ